MYEATISIKACRSLCQVEILLELVDESLVRGTIIEGSWRHESEAVLAEQ